MKSFKQFMVESSDAEIVEWNKPLFHGTSMAIARKILKLKHFDPKEGGFDEMGRGLYTHPSMNRTSPWTSGTANGKPSGAFIKIEFNRPLSLVIRKRGIDYREMLESGVDGIYDKNGDTQVPHQIMLFLKKTARNGTSRSK